MTEAKTMTVELTVADLERILRWSDVAANEGQFDKDDEALADHLMEIANSEGRP